MLNKNNLILAFVLTIFVNYIGWNEIVIPARRDRLAREFQLKAEAKQPPKIRALIRAKQRKLKYPPASRKSLLVWEWVCKLIVFSLAPGIFLLVLVRRRTFNRLPNGKSVLFCAGLGMVSDVLSLWWIAPATYFYLAAVVQIVRSDSASYPHADRPSYLAFAWSWIQPNQFAGSAKTNHTDEEDESQVASRPSRPPSRTKRFAKFKLRRRSKKIESYQSKHDAS